MSRVLRLAADRDCPAVRALPGSTLLTCIETFMPGCKASSTWYGRVVLWISLFRILSRLEAWYLACCIVPFGREKKGRQRRIFPAAPRANVVLRPGRRWRAFHSGPEPASSFVFFRMYSLQPVICIASSFHGGDMAKWQLAHGSTVACASTAGPERLMPNAGV